MDNVIDLAVGFDQKEAVAYHTFVQSVLEKASIPVRFIPLNIKSLSVYSECILMGVMSLYIPDF